MKCSKAELAWLKKLEKFLSTAPKSLMGNISSYTIGDNDITVYSQRCINEYTVKNPNSDELIVCELVSRSNAEIIRIKFPFMIEATSG